MIRTDTEIRLPVSVIRAREEPSPIRVESSRSARDARHATPTYSVMSPNFPNTFSLARLDFISCTHHHHPYPRVGAGHRAGIQNSVARLTTHRSLPKCVVYLLQGAVIEESSVVPPCRVHAVQAMYWAPREPCASMNGLGESFVFVICAVFCC